jgi:transketolase
LNGVRAAVAAAIAGALDADPRLVVVAAHDDPLLQPVLATRPGRRVLAPGPGSRLPIAEGLAGCGRRVLVGLSGHEPVAGGGGAQVLVTGDAAQAAIAQTSGLVVHQPAWPIDAEPLLQAALAAGAPVMVRAHPHSPEGPPPAPADGGLPRTLARGPDGVVVGAGGAVPLLLLAVEVIAKRGTALTAVDLHTLAGPAPIDLRTCDAHVWVGGPEAAAEVDHDLFRVPLRVVAVGGRNPSQAADAILGAVPAA